MPKKRLSTNQSKSLKRADSTIATAGSAREDRDEERKREVLEEFNETVRSPPVTTPRKRNYTTPQLRSASLPTNPMGFQVEVPVEVRFAASFIREALDDIANGSPFLPGIIPDNGERPISQIRRVSSLTNLGADGTRGATTKDFERVLRAFLTLTKFPIEKYWERILEIAIHDAIASRSLLSGLPEAVIAEGLSCPVPPPPTAAQVLDVVRRFAPAGTVPNLLTEEAIEAALERCTIARGGGRGEAKAKWSIRKWIDWFKREVLARPHRRSQGGRASSEKAASKTTPTSRGRNSTR